MTKADRAKIRRRMNRLWFLTPFSQQSDLVLRLVVREVDRAVRDERQAKRDTEELWASHRRRADEQMIERTRGLGRKRS